VLATDGKLWREFDVWNNERSPRVRVDSSVKAFQALDSSTIYVLGHEASCGANSAAPIMTNGRALRLTPMSRRSTQTLSTCLGLMETFGEKRGPCKSGPGSQRTSTHSRLSMTVYVLCPGDILFRIQLRHEMPVADQPVWPIRLLPVPRHELRRRHIWLGFEP
jgi:hypothetical protein